MDEEARKQAEHDEETLRREQGLEEVVSKVVARIKEDRPGLWANIHAQRERGEKPARKGSKAYKAAVKAGKKINAMTEAEETLDPATEKAAEQSFDKALDLFKSADVKPSPKDKELKEIEPISMTLGLIVSAPGLIRILGKVSDVIASPFLKPGQQSKVGKALEHFGHEMEDVYLRGIADVLKKAFPQTWGNMPYDKNNELGKAAKKAYIGILVAAGISAGLGAVNAHSVIIKGIEGGMAAIKAGEAAELGAAIAGAA